MRLLTIGNVSYNLKFLERIDLDFCTIRIIIGKFVYTRKYESIDKAKKEYKSVKEYIIDGSFCEIKLDEFSLS